MFNINFVNEKATDEQLKDFYVTVKFEELDMRKADMSSKIATLDKKIENKNGNYTTKQVDGFKSERETLNTQLEKIVASMSEIESVHDKVIAEMCSVESAYGNKNRPDSVRNLLRIVAGADCKLLRYAIVDSLAGCDDIFKAFECASNITNVTEDGNNVQSPALKKAYKDANSAIQKMFKDFMSIEVENPYTTVKRIKFNGTDLNILHKLYVTGVRNEFDKEDGAERSTFAGRNITKLISQKKNKNGNVTLNMKKFAEKVCDLTVAHLAK